MDISKKIKAAEAYAGISEAEHARKMGTSSQAWGQRLKTGKFSSEDLEKIADTMGAKVILEFRFTDGTAI